MHKYLFGWEAIKADIAVRVPDENQLIPTARYKAIVRSDTHEVLGVHKPGYTIHQPATFLLEHMKRLAGDGVVFAGGGLIRGGSVGYAEVTLPEPVTDDNLGLHFRPNIIGFTSFDASRATDYVDSARFLSCDNQFPALAKNAKRYGLSYRHTANSLLRAEADVNVARELLQDSADLFIGTAVRLSRLPANMGRFLDLWAPLPDDEGRAYTRAENRRETLTEVYSAHPAVTHLSHNGFRILQAVNTYHHHFGEVRGRSREIANADRVITGRQAKLDAEVIGMIEAAA
jgi:phage/plasmid-like protein (TIGR03299 family)